MIFNILDEIVSLQRDNSYKTLAVTKAFMLSFSLILKKEETKSFLLFYHLDNVKQSFASLTEITNFCNTLFLWLCKTQTVFLNPLAGSIQKTAECIFHVHSRLMATRTLTSRRNLERELSNILISEAIFVFIFSGCKTYLSVRSFVEGISAPSDHYPHHPKHYENINRQV